MLLQLVHVASPPDHPTCLRLSNVFVPWISLTHSYAFVPRNAPDKNAAVLHGLSKDVALVTWCRSVTKKDVKESDALPGMVGGP